MMDSTLYDSFDCKITCEEYYGDEPDPDEPDWDADNDIEPDPDLDEVPDIEREWDADEEQYYLENPDEWPGLDVGEYEEWVDRHINEHGLTADGYALLASMDSRGEFV